MSTSTAGPPLLIDAAQPDDGSLTRLRFWREAGLDAVLVAVSAGAGLRATLAGIAAWHRRFAGHAELIAPVRSSAELRAAAAAGRTGVILGLDSPAPIGGDGNLLAILHLLGVRALPLSDASQGLLAGGCEETEDAGLTRLGRTVVAEMNRLGMVIDLSLAGEKSTLQTIAASTRPVAICHANPAAWQPGPGNKSARVLRALIDAGGMLGLSRDPSLLREGRACSLEAFCTMIARTAEAYGLEGLGIGSGLRLAPQDAASPTAQGEPPSGGAASAPAWFDDLADPLALRAGLAEIGFAEDEVDAIMGLNWLRFFDRVLVQDG